MASLFGSKWERENGCIGDERFYDWADVIEPMKPEHIRNRFDELEKRFKRDVAEGKDIWPPTIALFLALASQTRVNEAMYQRFTYELPEHTKAKYQEMGKRGIDKIKQQLNNKEG